MNAKLREELGKIVDKQGRRPPEAYEFLLEAVDFAMRRKHRSGKNANVTGLQLGEAFRDFCREQFGPMAATVLKEWRILSPADLAEMVMHLVEIGLLLKKEDDKPDDFNGSFDFEADFVRPFDPEYYDKNGEYFG